MTDALPLWLIALALAALWWDHGVGVRALIDIRGELRRLAPGCTCPLKGAASSTCPAHREHGPRGVEPTWYPPVPPPRAPPPPPDSTDAFYVPPDRNE